MKYIHLFLFVSVVLFSCKQGKTDKILIPRALKTGETFNEFPKSKVEIFDFKKVDSNQKELPDTYQISFKDTALTINKEPKPLAVKFLKPKYLNSQKTAVVAQVADKSGMVSPFYIFSFKDNKLEAIELDKPSSGKQDAKITKGLEDLNRSTMLINNDYLITTINGKIYPIKRQDPAQRVQGKIFMISKDAGTLIFLTSNSLYQVNYLTGESFNLPVDEKMLNNETSFYDLVRNNYSWFKNSNGTFFLKKNLDDDRVVDIKDFKR